MKPAAARRLAHDERMAVIGLTSGSAAKASRPSAASAASVATTASHPRRGPRCARRPASQGQTERGDDRETRPAASSRRDLGCGRALRRVDAGSEAPGSSCARAERQQPPRQQRPAGATEDAGRLGREVPAAGQQLGDGAVGDHAGRRRAGPPGRRTSAANSGSWVATITAWPSWRPAAQLGGERGLRGPIHARASARPAQAQPPARPPPVTIASARRWRSPPERSRGLRSAISASPHGCSASAGGLLADPLMEEVVARVLQQQRRPARALRTRPRVGSSRPAAWRSRVDLPAPLRPISAKPRRAASTQVDAAQDRRAVGRARARLRAARRAAVVARAPPRASAPGRSARRRGREALRAAPVRQQARPRATSRASLPHARRGRLEAGERDRAARRASGAPADARAGPLQERRRGRRRRRPCRRRGRSRGRRPPGSARDDARPAGSSSPTPGSAGAAGRSARRRRPGPAARSARPSRTSRGRPARAAPRATRCFSPPESSCVGRSSSASIPSASATSSTAPRDGGRGQCRGSQAPAPARRGPCSSRAGSRDPGRGLPRRAPSSAGPCSRRVEARRA